MKAVKFILACCLLFSVWVVYLYFQQPSTETSSLEQLLCTRTQRYPNTPEVNKAFDLIENSFYNRPLLQTINQKGETVSFYSYWHQIIPCVEVVFKENLANQMGVEGYVAFTHEEIKPNKYPIYVDESYSRVSDITLSLLLIHEMQHLQQFLSFSNGEEQNCYQRESSAFAMQWNLVNELPENKKQELNREINSSTEHPQIFLVQEMVKKYNESLKYCKPSDEYCAYNKVIDNLEGLVRESEYYRKQCSE